MSAIDERKSLESDQKASDHKPSTISKIVAGIRESLPQTEANLMNAAPDALKAREERLRAHRTDDPRQPGIGEDKLSVTPASAALYDVNTPMLAMEWHGKKNVQMAMRASPKVTDPQDAVIRITSTTICGSDTHMYVNEIPGPSNMKAGDIMGHECMGIVESVGAGVSKLKVGDRVVVSAPISCGSCNYCKEGKTSLCDTTNPSKVQEMLMGHRTAGLLGYSHVTGGYSGGQAERVRVPFADINCLPVPSTLKDSQVLLLSDVCCTGFHGTELAEVREGDVVVVWGAGPVGLMAAYLSKVLKKAARVIIIDTIPARLQFATRLGLETLDFLHCKDDSVVAELQERVPGGPDRTIECVGYRFPRSWPRRIARGIKLESDCSEILRDMIYITKKGGNLAIIGDYFADTNAFPIGQLMEKAITLRGGQLYCQQYWSYLLSKIADGTLDLRPWITHQAPLKDGPEAFRLFDEKEDAVVKVQLVTDFGKTRPENDDVHLQDLKNIQ